MKTPITREELKRQAEYLLERAAFRGGYDPEDVEFFLKERDALIEYLRGETKDLLRSVRRADKTMRYSYGGGVKAKNAEGELPDGGRWKNSWELVEDFISRLDTLEGKE